MWYPFLCAHHCGVPERSQPCCSDPRPRRPCQSSPPAISLHESAGIIAIPSAWRMWMVRSAGLSAAPTPHPKTRRGCWHRSGPIPFHMGCNSARARWQFTLPCVTKAPPRPRPPLIPTPRVVVGDGDSDAPPCSPRPALLTQTPSPGVVFCEFR